MLVSNGEERPSIRPESTEIRIETHLKIIIA